MCSDAKRWKDGTDLHEHLGTAVALGRGAVGGHGLPVAGELQGEVLLHQLLDHLLEEVKGLYFKMTTPQ